jgi:hypothetical protein
MSGMSLAGDIFCIGIIVSGFVLFVWSMLDPDFIGEYDECDIWEMEHNEYTEKY